ncbi:MAG: alpha/beta fold hydrolase [Verrucomicrobiota bacterium JB023]|nr:alpha/beta fold hydrolase [Verrucomicrobiota bacterium JB023]
MTSTCHSESVTVLGRPLEFYRWLPEEEPRAAFFFLHGQGDFAQRYEEIAQVFLRHGVAFLSCDLPGHGNSTGRRGHVPSLELISQLTRLGLSEAREMSPGPVGFGGHSVGGLLSLAMLLEVEPAPDFSWISSPILRPDANQPAWKTTCLRPLSHVLPKATVSTRVTAEMCRIPLEGETPTAPLLFHNRISLSWGRTLIDLGRQVRSQPDKLPMATNLLLTQGGKDLICPPQYCDDYAEAIGLPDFRYEYFPGARHEPFADSTKEDFLETLSDWLSQYLSTAADSPATETSHPAE